MIIIYAYTILAGIFISLLLKFIVDFKNIRRLSRINKNNKKLDSICMVFQYEGSLDDIRNQIKSLHLHKNKLITIAVLVRNKIDTKTGKIIQAELQKVTKNKIILISFKNIRSITADIKNNCGSELVLLINKNQHLSKDFVSRVIKISSRYKNQPVFVPYECQHVGYSLGSLLSARSDLFSGFYHQIFGQKISLKRIQPGYVYRTRELKRSITTNVPVEGACQVQYSPTEIGILEFLNFQISKMSSSRQNKLFFAIFCLTTAIILFIDRIYIPNILLVTILFTVTIYLAVGLIAQFGGKKYSIYENICLILIMPIYLAIIGIDSVLAILKSLYQRISQNNKRNQR